MRNGGLGFMSVFEVDKLFIMKEGQLLETQEQGVFLFRLPKHLEREFGAGKRYDIGATITVHKQEFCILKPIYHETPKKKSIFLHLKKS